MNQDSTKSYLATQSVLLIIASIIIVGLASFFIINSMLRTWHVWDLTLHAKPRMLRIINEAKALPDAIVQKRFQNFRRIGIIGRISNKPLKKGLQIQLNTQHIGQALTPNARGIYHVSVKLNNAQWLTLRSLHFHPLGYLLGLGFVLLILLSGLIFFIKWVIARITNPIEQLTYATRQFGEAATPLQMSNTGPPLVKAAIQAFNTMQARIKRLIDDRTQMLAAISHDLRTPITRLKLRAEALPDDAIRGPMINDLHEMDAMITSILSFARDYAKDEASERFDLASLITTICDDLIDTGASITYKLNPERLAFDGRLLALKRALTNLIENAVKYGEQAEVELKINETNNTVQISIIDHGPGIAEQELDHVFQPFYRADKSRNLDKPGSGLGLTVARDIIMTHGGDIKLRNLKSQGLQVLVMLKI